VTQFVDNEKSDAFLILAFPCHVVLCFPRNRRALTNYTILSQLLFKDGMYLIIPTIYCSNISNCRMRNSSVVIATRLPAGRPGFDSQQRKEIFLFSLVPIPALVPTQAHIQWVPGALSQLLKRKGGRGSN
jgi:hypothetical protein